MSRQPRITGEYMHIIVRGNGKQILFEDNRDKRKYIFYLEKYAAETEISILAYCLMENHVHLLVRDTNESISIFMKKMGVGYSRYYNEKYERTGHLFQDRFKSEVIKDEVHLLSAFRYILNNPVKAGICRAEEYTWSSFREYGKEDGVTDSGVLCEIIGGNAEFLRFLHQTDENDHIEAYGRKNDDAWALQKLQFVLQIANGTQLQEFDRKKRDAALALLKREGLTIRQIERLTGINRGVIQKAGVNGGVNGDGSD